jgi:hypothetical protein
MLVAIQGNFILPMLEISLRSWGEARGQWLMPVILATQEAEIRRIMIRSQPRQIVCETLSQKPIAKKGWWSRSRYRL